MPRSSPIQVSFNGGELSPRMFGRLDQPRYQSGAERMENFIPLVQGPAIRRSGFRFIGQTLGSLPVRLVPFPVSDEESYMLAFSDQRIRFYRNESSLLVGGVPLEVITPYTEDQLFTLQYAQSVDVMYLVHPQHAPRKLVRETATSFTLSEVDFFEGPFNLVGRGVDDEIVETTLSTAGGIAGATITVTASADLFEMKDVGRSIRIGDVAGAGDWGHGTITAFTSATSVDVLVVRTVLMQTATRFWRLGAWYTGNFPSVVTFDDERLWFGGDPDHPQTIYGSVVGDFENFTLSGVTSRSDETEQANEVNPDNALRLTISANNVNAVRWLFGLRTLLLATSGGLWSVQASSNVEPLQPDNAGARRSNDRGGSNVLPQAVGSSAVYVSQTQRRLFRAVFELENETFQSEDLSVFADHLIVQGIKQMAWSGDPANRLWIVTNDGRLLGVTIEALQETLAWHRHTPGGSDVQVESVAVIPAPVGAVTTGARENERHEQLWVVVNRTINGTTFRSLEILEDDFLDDDTIADGFFVDSGISYDGAPATVFAGLGHLEGETVEILADGAAVGGKVVSGGQVTLDSAASRVHIGLPYTSRLRLLRLEAGDETGTSQGKLKRVDHITLRFYRSQGGEVGNEERGFDPIEYPDAELLGDPSGLVTGDVTVTVDTGWDTTGQLEVRTAEPKPMTLLAAIHRVQSSQRGTS